MTARDALEDSNFIPNLKGVKICDMTTGVWAYHVFTTFHKLFVDNFACIVLSGLDMNSFLDYGISSAAERLAGSILARSVSQE